MSGFPTAACFARSGKNDPVIKRCLTVLAIALLVPTAAARPTLDAVPGGLVEIPLVPVDQARPEATFGQKRILVMEFGAQWVGLVGLPLSLVPGRYIIQARAGDEDDDEPLVREFTVYPRRTGRQETVQLPEPDTEAIELVWRDSLDARFPLAPPVPGPAQPLFGRYRQVSETQSRQVDFVAFQIASDTPVTAPGNGRIAATTQHESGTFVWIDHGMGLYTRIGPITHAAHGPGEPVKAGQHIGSMVLDTDGDPRSLYWWIFLNGAAVDPFLISTLNRASLDGTRGRPAPSAGGALQPSGSASYFLAAIPISYHPARDFQ